MSNPDRPGSYWQEQDDPGYRDQRRTRPVSPDRYQPWDGGRASGGQGGGGRPDGRGSNGGRHASRGSGPSHSNGNGRGAGYPNGNGNGRPAGYGNGNGRAAGYGNGNGSRREAPTWTGMISGRARGDQRQRSDSRWREWTDQFSQTAGDLKTRLGKRASAAGRAAADWPSRSRGYADGSGGSGTTLRPRGDSWQGGQTTRLGTRTAIRPGTGVGGAGRGGGRGGGYGGGRWDGRYSGNAWERFKRYLRSGDWWRHWTVKKVLALVGGFAAFVILLMVGAFFIVYENTKIPNASELTANWQSSIVYFSNGQQLGTFDSSQGGTSIERLLLTSNEIPGVMTQAMTAAEDRHFYTEGGVSLTGLARAALSDVFGHGTLQGGSTITMQYAKNYYSGVDTGQNLSTKLKEIIIAMKLGHERSKSWVMTNYLNTVDFGGTNLGLGAAAENYFDVNLTQGQTLTISQAAMLAAMPNAPGFFDPEPSSGAGYTALVARWHYVLDNMVKDGNITQKVANEQKFPAITPPTGGNGESGPDGYLMSMVQQQLEAPPADGGFGLTAHQLNTGGYTIKTTFSQSGMTALAASIAAEQQNMQQQANEQGASGFQSYDRMGAVLEDPTNGAILAVYGGPGYSSNCTDDCWINMAESPQPVGSSFKPYVLSEAVNEGMNVFTSTLNGFSPIWIPESPANTQTTEDTLSVTSPPTGVSASANGGWSPSPDAPGAIYYFKFDEADEDSGKGLAVNVAAAISSDPAFEDLAHRDGVQNIINMAQAFGVGQNAFVEPCSVPASQSPNATQGEIIADCNDLSGSVNGLNSNFGAHSTADTAGSPAIALGENPLTPVEQATTFATLADDGLYHTPHVIQTLMQGTKILPNNYVATQVLSKSAAADVDWALSFDNNMSGGTAEGSVPYRRGDVIGKTGTLGQDAVASQAWFNGATPDGLALSIDLFTNDPGTENLDNLPYINGTPGSQGGGWPATTWNEFMQNYESNAPYIPLFQTTDGAPFTTWTQVAPKKVGTCSNLQQFLQSQQQVAQGGQATCTCPDNNLALCNGNGNGNGGTGGTGTTGTGGTGTGGTGGTGTGGTGGTGTGGTGGTGTGGTGGTGTGGTGGGGGGGDATTAVLIPGASSASSAAAPVSSAPVLVAEEATSGILLLGVT